MARGEGAVTGRLIPWGRSGSKVDQIDELQEVEDDPVLALRRDPVHVREEAEVVAHAKLLVRAEDIGHVTHGAPDLLRLRAHIEAGDCRRALRGLEERREDTQERALPGAVRAHEAADLPLAEREARLTQR